MFKLRISLAMLIFAALTFAPASTTPVALAGGGECTGDVDGNGTTDVLDLLAVIIDFGVVCDPDPCDADLDGDGEVGFGDVLEVIFDFGCGLSQCADHGDCDDDDDCTVDICVFGMCFNVPIPSCG
jgi:hypothetical protein